MTPDNLPVGLKPLSMTKLEGPRNKVLPFQTFEKEDGEPDTSHWIVDFELSLFQRVQSHYDFFWWCVCFLMFEDLKCFHLFLKLLPVYHNLHVCSSVVTSCGLMIVLSDWQGVQGGLGRCHTPTYWGKPPLSARQLCNIWSLTWLCSNRQGYTLDRSVV